MIYTNVKELSTEKTLPGIKHNWENSKKLSSLEIWREKNFTTIHRMDKNYGGIRSIWVYRLFQKM